MDWLIGAWLFVLGAVVGSFLNVVIYRLPAGMNVIRPGSRCPACGHPIRWYDNVPILSWSLLRGRCRDCLAPISARYPAVEAATAVLFLALGLIELLPHGANWPAAGTAGGQGTYVQLGAVYAYHLLLLCTLFAAAVIEYDGRQLPLRLFVPAGTVGLAWAVIEQWVRPASAWTRAQVGTSLIVLFVVTFVLPRDKQNGTGRVLAAACPFLFLGPVAGDAIIVGAAVLCWLTVLAGRFLPAARRGGFTAWLFLAALGWLLGLGSLTSR